MKIYYQNLSVIRTYFKWKNRMTANDAWQLTPKWNIAEQPWQCTEENQSMIQIGYVADKMSQWRCVVRYERHIAPNNDDDAGNFARQTHFALPRDEIDAVWEEERACVVPYMGGNWAPDYVGLIHGPESTNMCFNLTDGCQMDDICPWESILLTNWISVYKSRSPLAYLAKSSYRLMYIF